MWLWISSSYNPTSNTEWVFVTSLILLLICEDLMREVFSDPQAMSLQQADLWYPSSSDRSRSVETSRSSSPSSQHSSLAVEPAAQHGLSSLRYLTASVCLFIALLLHISPFSRCMTSIGKDWVWWAASCTKQHYLNIINDTVRRIPESFRCFISPRFTWMKSCCRVCKLPPTAVSPEWAPCSICYLAHFLVIL